MSPLHQFPGIHCAADQIKAVVHGTIVVLQDMELLCKPLSTTTLIAPAYNNKSKSGAEFFTKQEMLLKEKQPEKVKTSTLQDDFGSFIKLFVFNVEHQP